MKYRRFGTSGLMVSELSFGAMRVTGDAAHVARPKSPTKSEKEAQNDSGRAALELALDSGVNCIHSSEDYGTWWLIADVLRGNPMRTEVHHVIKTMTPDYEDVAFSAAQIRYDVESALSALGAERISFVQHLQRGPKVNKSDAYSAAGDDRRIAALTSIADDFGALMENLRQEGKAEVGVTFPHTVEFANAALSTGHYGGVAHFFNLIEPEALPLLDRAVADGYGYFAIRPLLQGMLTDKRSSIMTLDSGDPKSRGGWSTRYELLEKIKSEVGDPESLTLFALQFALSHPGVTSLITSASNPTQMRVMLDAVYLQPLDRHILDIVGCLALDAGALPKSDLFVENLLA